MIAIGDYDVGAYLWVEGALVLGTIAAGLVVFSKRARGPLARLRPLFAALRLERPLRAVYEGMHTYRTHAALLAGLLAFTLVIQAIRVLPIWLVGKSVAIDLPPRPYYVMGPILFVVLLAPFTINGLAVREAFFVSFLGNLGVGAAGVRSRVPLLPRHDPDGGSRRIDPRVGSATPCLTSRPSSSRTTRCRGSRRRSKACAGPS